MLQVISKGKKVEGKSVKLKIKNAKVKVEGSWKVGYRFKIKGKR